MSRIPLGYFIIAGLVFWGLPGVLVAGYQALFYIFAAILPVWWLTRRRYPEQEGAMQQAPWISGAASAVLAAFAGLYLICDATFGSQLLQFNLFLHHESSATRLVDDFNQSTNGGGGFIALLGTVISTLPFAMIDATRRTSRYGVWVLWIAAILLLFYETTSGRSFFMMAVMAIFLGRTSDWRRITLAGLIAIGAFFVASSFRGDLAATQNPLANGTVFPFINLALMLHANCGTAPWYAFIAEFLKKFVPGFLLPKTIFPFNLQMSLCIYPSADNTVSAISIFTWLGEIFYYTPSLLTAFLAGLILGLLGRLVDRRLVVNQLYSVRVFVGLMCILLPRSRTQDEFSLLIAQVVFLFIVWPQLCNLPRNLRMLLVPNHPASDNLEPQKELP